MKLSINVDWIPTVESIICYLINEGWHPVFNKSQVNTFLCFKHNDLDSKYQVCIPATNDFSDYEKRIKEFLANISCLEKRSEYNVWSDIHKLAIRKARQESALDELIQISQELGGYDELK